MSEKEMLEQQQRTNRHERAGLQGPLSDAEAMFIGAKELPEAPAQASCKIVAPSGFSWLVVIRAGLMQPEADDAVRSLLQTMHVFEKEAAAAKMLPLTSSFNGQDLVSLPIGQDGLRGEGSGKRTSGQPQQNSGQQRQSAGNGLQIKGYTNAGIGTLTKIVMGSLQDGKPTRIGFFIDNRQKAIYENRGGEAAATLFKDECWGDTWKRSMLKATDVVYTSQHFGNLEALSGKGEERGYWDVIRVRVVKSE